MTRKKALLGLGGLATVVIALAAGAFWYFFLRDEAPAPVSLEAAATAAAASSAGNAASTVTSDLTGTWTIKSGGASFAGYRVDENLVGFGAKEAVGRTQAIQGLLSYDGHSISNLQVAADLTAMKSDQPLRDDTLKTTAIQTCQFPTATFTLTAPVAIEAAATTGTISRKIQGTLTLHGVTKPVSIDVRGQLVNGQAVIAGSLPIAFADFNIAQPRSIFVVSLDDHGIMEFQLIFTKSEGAAPTALQPVATPTSGCGGFPGGPGVPIPGGTRPAGGAPPAFTPPTGGFPGGGGPGINTPAPVPSPVQ